MHRWIQVEKSKNIELSITFPILSLGGYEYTKNDGKLMLEYHVNIIPELKKRMTNNFFGIDLSVTMGLGVRPLT